MDGYEHSFLLSNIFNLVVIIIFQTNQSQTEYHWGQWSLSLGEVPIDISLFINF